MQPLCTHCISSGLTAAGFSGSSRHRFCETRCFDKLGEVVPGDIEKGGAQPESSNAAPPPAIFDPRQNPDLGGFCTLFCSFGWINAIAVFQNYYQTHQLAEYSPSTIAWIPSLETFMNFFLGPVVGAILDRYGHRWLLIVGTFLHVFGLMMTSLCTEYYQFILAQGICSPIGVCMIFFPAMASITTWFYKKRAFAFGIVAAGSSLGGVIFPIMIQRLIDDVGFGWSMRIAAFLILFLMIIANLTITSRMPPRKTPFKLMAFIEPLKEVPFDLTAFGSFLFFLGLFIPINYIITEAVEYGMSENLAQYLVSILNAASLFGRVLPGYVADRIGRFNMTIIMCFFSAVIVLAMWIPSKANAPIIVFAALYGFGSGAFVSLAPSMIAQISDVRKIGVRTGTFFATISIAALISNPIGGALITRWDGKYTGLQIFAGVIMFAGSCFIAAARVRLSGPKIVEKI
ncbi:hypothetical protein M409DRAFT_62108 [Zasmidium cellare ATCC 36951]|uniref:Major facilitator superfamily (MFS) profile domain-containing protein n=1 Tax=Zasmidium cellare ATCC 36951 TaxID=1080233 RepID=A0A6A6D389_ZASCE|nr:uncharacterized protein M409DRAFT_62108 [Zasmidium cellare ATCC 36951]KAF2173881.1 hypothetical protein M409DRAFT_62108 [Zasmidium cellare ATCC 36951]